MADSILFDTTPVVALEGQLPEAHATIRVRYTREMSAGELQELGDRFNAEAAAIVKQLDDYALSYVEKLSKREHELAEYFTGVAEREEAVAGKEAVLAGAREAVPEDLATWKADVARREAAVKAREQELGCRYTVADLNTREHHLALYEEILRDRAAQLVRDRTAFERTRAQASIT